MDNSFSFIYFIICISYVIYTICKYRRNRIGQRYRSTREEGDDDNNIQMDDDMQNLQTLIMNYLTNRPPSHGMNPEQRRAHILDRLIVKKGKDIQELNLKITHDQEEKDKEAKYEVVSTTTSEKQFDSKHNIDHDAMNNNNDDIIGANTKGNNEEEEKCGDEEDQQRISMSEDTLIKESDGNEVKENDHGREKNGDEEDQLGINNNDTTITELNRPSPLEAIVEDLQSSIVPSEPKEENEMEKELDNVCPICLAEFEGEDEICKSKNEECQHLFHLDCMVEWLMKHDECPLCRCDYLKKPSNDIDNERRERVRRLILPERYNSAVSSFGQQSGSLIVLRRNSSVRSR
jgi:hypothetical protein